MNKLKALVNCVSHRVLEYIADCDSYDEAITVLRNLYKKAPNEVFARHLLASAKQQPEETLDEFHLKLQKLARDCNFRQVTSEQYSKKWFVKPFRKWSFFPWNTSETVRKSRP